MASNLELIKFKKTRVLRNRVRVLLQTVLYGFIAGTLFFCSVKLALEANRTRPCGTRIVVRLSNL